MSSQNPIVGLLTVDLYIADANTLKDKRRVVKSLLDRLANRFNVAVAEVGLLDNQRHAYLGLTTVANDGDHVQRVLEACRRFVTGEPRVVLEGSTLDFL